MTLDLRRRWARLSQNLERPHFLESGLNRKSQLADFFFVDLRRGVEHDEEGKQEGDEVSIGNQPALVIGVTGASPAAAHAFDASGTAVAGLRASVRNPSSFSSNMRGFIPSRMETTPSSTISRMMCSSRMRIFSFPAAGSKMRLAAPTP